MNYIYEPFRAIRNPIYWQKDKRITGQLILKLLEMDNSVLISVLILIIRFLAIVIFKFREV